MRPSVFDPRLESVTVAETELSDVDGESGELLIGGYPVEELAANATYEEVLFLLWEGRLPTAEELDALRRDLADRRAIGTEVRSVLRQAAQEGKAAMDALRMGVAAADLGTGEAEPREQARRVVAAFPTIVATYWRFLQGEEPVEPRDDLGHAANYHYMLTGTEPTDDEVRGLDTFLTTIVDHGLNASTFTARVVASTESDLVSAATAAVGALKGPRHAGRLSQVFDALRTVHERGDPEAYVRARVEDDEPVPGFGHRLYRVRDPRAAVLSAATERFTEADDDFLATAREFEAVTRGVLAESQRQVAATVEFYAVTLLHSVGIPPELFTATFGVSRVGGWTAHCLEQLDDNRLVRPVGRYVGDADNDWTPIEDRYVAGDTLVGQPLQSASLEPVSETLATLSEQNRLEILLALYDTDGPVPYSTLRAATSIEDKGKLNYHLRQLREYFVVKRDDGYGLTDAGRTLVQAVLTDDRLLDGQSD